MSSLHTLTFRSISLDKIKIFKTIFRFTDLGLHFDLCENESYSTFVGKAELFYVQKSKKAQLFLN